MRKQLPDAKQTLFSKLGSHLCGIWISDGTDARVLMVRGQPGALHLPLSFHNTQEPQTRHMLLPGLTHLPLILQDGSCFSRYHLGNPESYSQTGIFQPQKTKFCSFISWLSVPGSKAHSPRGTEQPQQQCSAADKSWLFSTSPFLKAQFRLKSTLRLSPNRGISSTARQQHNEALTPTLGLTQHQKTLFDRGISK